MNIAIIGLGYVGITTMLSFARDGFSIHGFDKNTDITKKLKKKKVPFFEPGLQSLLEKYHNKIKISNNLDEISNDTDIIFICVGTPQNKSKTLCMKQINSSIKEITKTLNNNKKPIHLSIRSTVPVGTMVKINEQLTKSNDKFYLSYNPEFLREGNALKDISNPEVIVVGHQNPTIKKIYKTLHKSDIKKIKFVPFKEAELIKSINNTWHALKICFANEMQELCGANDISINMISDMFLADKVLNISSAYLKPGFPYGGSCLEKDSEYLKLLSVKSKLSLPILTNINKSNQTHYNYILKKIISQKPKCVTLTSIAFKKNTDDIRNSIKIRLAEDLISNKIKVKIYDKVISRMINSKKKSLNDYIKSSEIFKYYYTELDKSLRKSDIAIVFSENLRHSNDILKLNPTIKIYNY